MEGQRVFITGAATGLGKALSEAYAKQGAKVFLTDINEEQGQETTAAIAATGATVHFMKCDVTKEEDFAAAAKWMSENWDGVDLVINNAGVAQMGQIAYTKIEDWQWAIDINVVSIARSSKVFIPLLKKSNNGKILNIASMAGLIYLPGAAVYNATKSAVMAISETMYIELEADKIDVHVACPAFFRTDLAKNMRATDPLSNFMTKRMVERARIGAEEIAEKLVEGVNKGNRIIFTHPQAERTWLMKRYLPSWLYFRQLRQQLQQMQDRMSGKKKKKK